MKLARLTDRQQHLLEHYEQVGGVVEFVVIEGETQDRVNAPVESHRAAIQRAFRELQRRSVAHAQQAAVQYDLPVDRFFEVQFDEHALKSASPHLVSWQQCLGSRYDFDRGGLIVHGMGKYLNEFFFYNDSAKFQNIYPSQRVDNGLGTGLAYAFSDPPHGMGLKAKPLGELFEAILEAILEASTITTIYEWPTDWSNYFEAGNEWWGSFLWSTSNSDMSRIVIAAASTTD